MNTRAQARQEAARRSWEGEFSYEDQHGVRCTISPVEAFVDGAVWGRELSAEIAAADKSESVGTISSAELLAHARRLDERIDRHGGGDSCPECTDMRAGNKALTALAMIVDLLPGPRTFGESLSRDINGKLFPRKIDADQVAGIIAGSFLTAEATAPVPVSSPPANCTCPSGDGPLRWPCPAHPPTAHHDTEAPTP